MIKETIKLENIKRLVTMHEGPDREGVLGVIEEASIFVKDGKIVWIGKSSNFPVEYKAERIIGCEGKTVLPGLVEAHTHLVYAGSRENEFRMRSKGATYSEIAKAGGGILSTVKATREASEDELLNLAIERADEALSKGITTIEIKSGYGLDIKTEEKILRVAKKLGEIHSIDTVGTFLGAHVVPAEYKSDREKYLSIVTHEMLPRFASEGLCAFCDIFVEEGAYTEDEARALAVAAHKLNVPMKLHVDQFADHDGGRLAAEIGAVSADHLDFVSDEGILAMAKKNVSAVLLPTAAFFTNSGKQAPARKLLDAGVNVVISTDYNPGTSPTLDLMLCATMDVCNLGMTIDEALRAITINAAKSLCLDDQIGSISIGKKADLVIFNAPNEDYLLYHFGANFAETVIKSGKVLDLSFQT